MRYVLAGAEPVKETTRRIFMEKFGLRVLEGYGVTETAPVARPQHADVQPLRHGRAVAARHRSAARTGPGVEEGGRLHVRGPNVMLGYLKSDNPGVIEPPPEGWHDTGDIVTIDADRFCNHQGPSQAFRQDRRRDDLAGRGRSLAAELWPDALSAVVTARSAQGREARAGHRRKPAPRTAFQAYAKSKGAADLLVPREIHVVDKVPVRIRRTDILA